MVYIIEQIEGEQYNASCAVRLLARIGDIPAAEKVWEEVLGEEPPNRDHNWWEHNAPIVLRRRTGLSVEDWQWVGIHIRDEREKAEIMARLVELRRGGEWRAVWEY